MISVCIATYNGEKYIKQQLVSILTEVGCHAEIIICDDNSTDNTISIIESLASQQVKLYKNTIRLGHVRNFEKALSLSRGEYIFLSDQDDVWLQGRVKNMLSIIKSDPCILLAASNFEFIDNNGDIIIGRNSNLGNVKKLPIAHVISILTAQSPYFGCTFLMRRELLEFCLPIPVCIESHDIWIALVASSYGRVLNIEDATIRHRIHDRNVTTKHRRSLWIIGKSRFCFLKSLLKRLLQLKFRKLFEK